MMPLPVPRDGSSSVGRSANDGSGVADLAVVGPTVYFTAHEPPPMPGLAPEGNVYAAASDAPTAPGDELHRGQPDPARGAGDEHALPGREAGLVQRQNLAVVIGPAGAGKSNLFCANGVNFQGAEPTPWNPAPAAAGGGTCQVDVTGDETASWTGAGGPMALNTDYWIVRVSSTTARVATSYANYVAGTVVAYTDAGSGTHTMTIQMPRYASGVGCQAAFVVQTAPTAGGPNLSASSYTNSAGTGSRAFTGSPTMGAAADAYAGRILHSGNAAGRYGPFLPLASGDTGIARVDSFTLSGGTAYTGHLDVTDYDEMSARITEFTAAAAGRLDIFINNAGVLIGGRFEELDVTAQHRMIDINCKGVVNGLHAAFPALRATGNATVVNLCSASAIYGQAELAAYSASKFAIRGLTEALELEWADDDIKVSAVWPLFVATDMVTGVDTSSTRALGVSLTADDVADSILKTIESKPLLPQGVHRAVGLQARALMAIADFAPSWVMREVNKRATGH